MNAVHRDLKRIRELLALGRDVDTELARCFQHLERHLPDRCCEHQCGSEPAHITLTASTSPEGPPMSDFPVGSPVYLTANVTNREDRPLADQTTWSATAADGTPVAVTVDPANAEWASIDGTQLGDITVAGTTSNGIAAPPLVVSVIDAVPAAITVTASSTPNAPAA